MTKPEIETFPSPEALAAAVAGRLVIRLAAGAPAMPHWRMRSGWMDSDFSGLGCAQQSVKFVVWWLYHALFESSATISPETDAPRLE